MDQQKINKFIGRLMAFHRSDDRASMAKLRQAAPRLPESVGEVLVVIGDQMSGLTDGEIVDFSMVATFFALHPHENGYGNFGTSFRKVFQHEKSGDSIKRRFEVLCASDRDRLHIHLYNAISLARARGVKINWFQLMTDVIEWSAEDRHVQYEWMKDFFVPKAPTRKEEDNDG